MPIPDFQSMMLPLLRLTADGQEHSTAELRDPLADELNLTADERKERLPSGQQFRLNNRVAWSKIYLERAGLLLKTRRGYFRITERGREVLAAPPQRIDIPYLKRFPEFAEFRKKNGVEKRLSGDDSENDDTATPEEALETAYQSLREDLAAELLAQVRAASPSFFEQLVVDLMLKMGYGGPGDDAGTVTSRGADGGIDGLINEDRLGLGVVYLQAKRWEGTVGRPEIQRFVGALHGHRARKGVFLTTSAFSNDATEYVKTIDPRVVLIGGLRLAQLMMDFNVGVSVSQTYEIKRIDSDYFSEE